MLKVKISKIVLMILTSFFCLHLTGLTVADECWKSKGDGPTVPGNYTYPPEWHPAFQYDPNNPDEIDRNSSVEISVIRGTPPYTWSVSGTGFSIPSSITDRTNALSANNLACGSAAITVTDNCGDSCTGYVRCTAASHWAIKTSDCILSGSGTLILYDCNDCNRAWHYELIVGNKKQTQSTAQWCFNDGYGPGGADNCIDPDHYPPEEVAWNYYTDYSECSNPENCENCDSLQKIEAVTIWNYEWECY